MPATEASASTYYPNLGGASASTDATVRATPTGAEISYVLRAVTSPQTETLRFSLPAGWRLEQPAHHAPNIAILAGDGSTRGEVEPVLAIDAQGQSVPASYRIVGRTQLVVSVKHRSGSYAYPILVDPAIAYYPTVQGYGDGNDIYQNWAHWTNSSALFPYKGTGSDGDPYVQWWGYAGYPYPAGSVGQFLANAYFQTYIWKLTEDNLSSLSNNSAEFGGIFQPNGSTPGWEPGYWFDSNGQTGSLAFNESGTVSNYTAGYCARPGCTYGIGSGIQVDNQETFGMIVNGSTLNNGQNPYAAMEYATNGVADNVPVSETTSYGSGYTPGTWTNNPPANLSVQLNGSTQSTFGIDEIVLVGAGLPNQSAANTCNTTTAATGSFCNRTQQASFTYPTSGLSEGSNKIQSETIGANGNNQEVDWYVNIDRTPPTIAPDAQDTVASGTLPLTGTVSDPTPSDGGTPSGLASVQAQITDVHGNTSTACTAIPSGGSYTCNWNTNTNAVADGTYSLNEVAYDNAGNHTSSSLGSIVVDNTAPTVAVSGAAYDARTGGSVTGSLSLTVSASDPGPASTTSGVTDIATEIDGTTVQAPGAYQACPQFSCSLDATGAIDASDLSPGSHTISVVATDAAGNTSTNSWTITAALTPPSGGTAPTIEGGLWSGVPAYATTSTWEGSAPLTIGYQWSRCNAAGAFCTPISGATGKSYAPPAADDGSTLVVIETASNSGGSNSVISPPSAAVVAPPQKDDSNASSDQIYPASLAIANVLSQPSFAASGAGSVVDTSGKTAIYTTTSDTTDLQAAISSAIGANASSMYTLNQVALTYTQLENLTGTVAMDLSQLTNDGLDVTTWGPDPATNSVNIEVDTTQTDQASLNQVLSTIENVVGVTSGITLTPVSTDKLIRNDTYGRNADVRPFKDGDLICAWGHTTKPWKGGFCPPVQYHSTRCTSGFEFIGKVSGASFETTANHCIVWTPATFRLYTNSSAPFVLGRGPNDYGYCNCTTGNVDGQKTRGGADVATFRCDLCTSGTLWHPGGLYDVVNVCQSSRGAQCGNGQLVTYYGNSDLSEFVRRRIIATGQCVARSQLTDDPNDPGTTICGLDKTGNTTQVGGDSGGPVYQRGPNNMVLAAGTSLYTLGGNDFYQDEQQTLDAVNGNLRTR